MPKMAGCICFIRYGREKEINNQLSSLADFRDIWGGDSTIHKIRKSELGSCASDITFADRYSVCVIDAEANLAIGDKVRKAKEFYNDTYLTDQNACTFPRIILWMGNERERTKQEFWAYLHEKVKKRMPSIRFKV